MNLFCWAKKVMPFLPKGGRCILTDWHFFNFFSLDGKLFATSKFSDTNIFEGKLPLLSLLHII